MSRYSCSLRNGNCIEDKDGEFSSLPECRRARCRGVVTSLDTYYNILSYAPQEALSLSPEDRVAVLRRILGFVVLPDDSYELLRAIAEDDYPVLTAVPAYLRKRLASQFDLSEEEMDEVVDIFENGSLVDIARHGNRELRSWFRSYLQKKYKLRGDRLDEAIKMFNRNDFSKLYNFPELYPLFDSYEPNVSRISELKKEVDQTQISTLEEELRRNFAPLEIINLYFLLYQSGKYRNGFVDEIVEDYLYSEDEEQIAGLFSQRFFVRNNSFEIYDFDPVVMRYLLNNDIKPLQTYLRIKLEIDTGTIIHHLEEVPEIRPLLIELIRDPELMDYEPIKDFLPELVEEAQV